MLRRDAATVRGFGSEWSTFDQSTLPDYDRQTLYDSYFGIFPWDSLPPNAKGFDFGCGSGRWAAMVAPRVWKLACIDASRRALNVAKGNVRFGDFYLSDHVPLPDNSQDFGYSLGVLHHIPDTQGALDDCVRALKPGAPFLLYIYYAFDNRGLAFKAVWKLSDLLRQGISRLPFRLRRFVTDLIAIVVYWPLSRIAPNERFPLYAYKKRSLYSLRTDALDRFGTRLEKRFTRQQVEDMMTKAGLTDIRFSNQIPYWVAVGFKRG